MGFRIIVSPAKKMNVVEGPPWPQDRPVFLDRTRTLLERLRELTFEEAAAYVSDDKDTRNNHGLMANTSESGRTSKFQMQDLPQDVARVVDTLQVGQVSQAFQMTNERGKTVCAIVKLKNRTEGHKATVTEDFQILKNVVLNKLREEKIRKWLTEKIKATYVRINGDYRDCDFEYHGWVR